MLGQGEFYVDVLIKPCIIMYVNIFLPFISTELLLMTFYTEEPIEKIKIKNTTVISQNVKKQSK